MLVLGLENPLKRDHDGGACLMHLISLAFRITYQKKKKKPSIQNNNPKSIA